MPPKISKTAKVRSHLPVHIEKLWKMKGKIPSMTNPMFQAECPIIIALWQFRTYVTKLGFNQVGKRVITFTLLKTLNRFIRENIATHQDHINASSANRWPKWVPDANSASSNQRFTCFESFVSRTPITKHDKTAAYFVSSFKCASNEVLPWDGSALTKHFSYLRCSMVWS